MGKTLAEKVWDEHVVRSTEGEPDLLYIDLHLIHEVTSPQAFDGLRLAGRTVRRPDLTLATEDHNVPTLDWDKPIADPVSRTQVETLRRNAEEFGVRLHPLGDIEQGIVHVVGPQLGLTQPGMTIVDDALLDVAEGVQAHPELLGVATQRLDLGAGDGVGDRLVPVDRGNVVVLGGEREVRTPHGAAGEPQPVERLRRGDLVDQVEIDVEEVRFAFGGPDDVLVPDLLGQGLAHDCLPLGMRVPGGAAEPC